MTRLSGGGSALLTDMRSSVDSLSVSNVVIPANALFNYAPGELGGFNKVELRLNDVTLGEVAIGEGATLAGHPTPVAPSSGFGVEELDIIVGGTKGADAAVGEVDLAAGLLRGGARAENIRRGRVLLNIGPVDHRQCNGRQQRENADQDDGGGHSHEAAPRLK